MFEYNNEEDYRLQINPNAALDENHQLYFQFVGRVRNPHHVGPYLICLQLIGLAVRNHHFLDCSFTSAFFKQLLGQKITLACVLSHCSAASCHVQCSAGISRKSTRPCTRV